MSRAVLFINGQPYLLSGIAETPYKISGYVENGAWNLVLFRGSLECYALDGTLKSEGPAVLDRIVAVPRAIGGDYNAIIEWAEKQS